MKLLDLGIAGHGGIQRWASVDSVSAELTVGGGVWALKGIPEVAGKHRMTVRAGIQHTTLSAFGSQDTLAVFDGKRTSMTDLTTGTVINGRSDPRSSIDSSEPGAQWNIIDAVYFLGYSLSNYVNAPFLFAEPGFKTEELTPWDEEGETWRRLQVTFPADIATHCRSQIFYFDNRGLLRRQDYKVDILGAKNTLAHYSYEYRMVSGLQFPARRRVNPIKDGTVDKSHDIITLDLSDIMIHSA
jgi:hypothetical protein